MIAPAALCAASETILSRLCERLPEHFTAPAASHDEDFVVLEPGEMALHHVLAGGARITHTIRY